MIESRKSDSFGLEEKQEGKIINEHKETFVSYECIHYFGVVMFSNYDTCQNLFNCACYLQLSLCQLYLIKIFVKVQTLHRMAAALKSSIP